MSKGPFRRRTRRSRMRGGQRSSWQIYRRSGRTKPEIAKKYLGYLGKNSRKAQEYREQFPWLEMVPPSEIGYPNNIPKYNVNSGKEVAVRACTLEKVRETLGEAPKFFDRCYENPKPCYHIFSKNTKNVKLTLGSLIIRSKNKCLSELAEHTSEYTRGMEEARRRFNKPPTNGSGPRDGETGIIDMSTYPGSSYEEPPISEYNMREEEEYERSRRGI